MAKVDLSTPPDWLVKKRQEALRKQDQANVASANVEARAQAFIADAEKNLNRQLSTEEEVEVYNKFARGEEVTLQDREEPEITRLPAVVVRPEAQEPKGFWATRASELQQAAGDIENFITTTGAGVQRTAAGLMEQVARASENTAGEDAITRGLRSGAGTLRAEAESVQKEIDAFKTDLESRSGLEGFIGAGAADALSNPTSLVSLVGGPVGLLAAADSYAQAYKKGAEEGLKGAELEAYALAQGVPELVSVIPAGKVLAQIPVIGPLFQRKVQELGTGLVRKMTNPGIAQAAELARTAVGESLEENFTGSVQDLAMAAFAGQNKAKELARVASEDAPLEADGSIDWEKFGQNRYRDTRAAVVMGGGMSLAQAPARLAEYDQAKEAETDTTTAAVIVAEQQRREAAAEQTRQQQAEEAARAAAAAPTVDGLQVEEVTPEALDEAEISEEAMARATDEAAAMAPVATPKRKPIPRKPVSAPVDVVAQQQAEAPSVEELRQQVQKARGKKLKMASVDTPAGRVPGLVSENRTPEQQDAFAGRVRDVVKKLSRANTEQGADIQNLMRQGKLIVTDRPESLGRDDNNAQAEYDVAEGRMYLYLDNLNTDDVKAEVAVSLHEATHAGQFNNREGRPDIYTHMMGSEGVAKANGTIRRAAKSGNKLAQNALAKAQKAAGPDADLENLELVPYFVGEAASSRGTTLGQLSGVARDIRSAARNFARSKLGRNLEFDLTDIDSAAQRVGGEIVQTELEGREGGDTLQMIGGRQATGFNRAQQQGRTFTPFVDGNERFEFSDENAELADNPESWREVESGKTINLNELFRHPELEAQYPDRYNSLKVKVDPSMPENVSGSYLNGTIYVPKSVGQQLANNPEELRNTILHEAQHAVQEMEGFVGGTNSENFVPSSIREMAQFDENRVAQQANEFEIAAGVNGLSPADKAKWADIEKTIDKDDRYIRASMFVEEGFHKKTLDRNVQRQGERFLQAKTNLQKSKSELRKAESRATKIYAADRGEAEARNVEARSRMTQAERDALPFESSIGQDVGLESEQLLDTTPYVGRPDRAPIQSRVLRAAQIDPKDYKVPASKFRPGERIQRLLAHGQRGQLADIKVAEDLDTRLQEALEKDTGNSRMDYKLSRKVNTILRSGGRDSRAYANLKKQYPNVAEVIAEARDRIRDATLETVEALLDSGRPLSAEERKNIQTLLANVDTYMTRAYAAFDKRSGRKWAKGRWENYIANIGNDLSVISNPKVKRDVMAVRKGLQFLKRDLTIPQDEVLMDMKMDELEAMLTRWGDDVNRLNFADTATKRAAITNALIEKRESLTDKDLKQAAEDAAKSLLGLSDTGEKYVRALNSLARDPGTLKERQVVPISVRRLLGEITYAPGAMLATLSNQAGLKARAQVISEILREETGKSVLTPEQWRKADAKTKKEFKLASGGSWGQLDGFYLDPRLYRRMYEGLSVYGAMGDAIAEAIRTGGNTGDLVKSVWDALPATTGRLNRYSKISTVIMNPFNWIGNVTGSTLTLIGSGNFLFRGAARGITTSGNYVAGTLKDTSTPQLEDAIRYLNMEAADIGELQNILGNKMKQYLDGSLDPREAQGLIGKFLADSVGAADRGFRTITAAYAVADNWAKVANFYHRFDTLKAMYAAAGDTKTEEEIAKEAGDDTSLTNLSPERVPAFIRDLESRGLSQYGPYFYEVIRTRFTGYQLAAADLQRGLALKAAGKDKAANIIFRSATARAAGLTMVNVAIPAIGSSVAAQALSLLGVTAPLLGLGGDDEEKEEKRYLLSDFNADQDLVTMGYMEDGRPIYLPVSQRFDPHGPFTDFVRALVYSKTDEELAMNMVSGLKEGLYVKPQWLFDLFKSATDKTVSESLTGEVVPELKKIGDEAIGSAATERVLNLFDAFLPGVLRSQATRNSAEGMTEGSDTTTAAAKYVNALPGVDKVTPEQITDVTNMIGAKFEVFNPERRLTQLSGDSKKLKGENSGQLNRDVATVTEVNKAAIMDAVIKFKAREMERFKNDYKAVKSLRSWGLDDEDIAKMMLDAEYTKTEVPLLVNGEGSAVIQLKSLGKYLQSSSGFKDYRDKSKMKSKGQQAIDLLIEMEPELTEMGVVLDKKGLQEEFKK